MDWMHFMKMLCVTLSQVKCGCNALTLTYAYPSRCHTEIYSIKLLISDQVTKKKKIADGRLPSAWPGVCRLCHVGGSNRQLSQMQRGIYYIQNQRKRGEHCVPHSTHRLCHWTRIFVSSIEHMQRHIRMNSQLKSSNIIHELLAPRAVLTWLIHSRE